MILHNYFLHFILYDLFLVSGGILHGKCAVLATLGHFFLFFYKWLIKQAKTIGTDAKIYINN